MISATKGGLAAALVLASPGCGASPPEERAQMAQVDTAGESAAILARIGLGLPSSARVEYARRMPGMDDAARLTAVLPEPEWAALQSRLGKDGAEGIVFSADDNFHLGPDEGEWKPTAAAGLKTAQLPWGGGAESLNLGVSPAGAGEVRLFVFWHQL